MASRVKNGIVKYFKDNIGIIIALIAMCIFMLIYPKTRTTFMTPKNLFNILRQNASNMFLATGMTMVIILGGIEASLRRMAHYRTFRMCGCRICSILPSSNRSWIYSGYFSWSTGWCI